jgi:Trypsin and protease inhibitor
MKFQLLSISVLVALLYSFTSSATSELVHDHNGEFLIPGQKYYILPFMRGNGGGVTMVQHNSPCPFYVGQENIEVDDGRPVTFHPVNSKQGFIGLSEDVNINFSVNTPCRYSTVWKLGYAEGAANNRYVMTGGSMGNPGQATVNNWFKIERWESTSESTVYKLVFCPSVCETCKVVCGDVGLFFEGDKDKKKRLLGLNGASFPVVFKKMDPEVEVQ